MISLFLSKRGTTYEQMLSQNGDIILEHCISATVKMERNAIWYLTIEVPDSELMGYSVTDESVFKVDLNFIKGQLFRMIYPKYNKTKHTYTFYASHIFFDAQYECMWDGEPQWGSISGASDPDPVSWTEAISKLNALMTDYKDRGGIELPYHIYGEPPSPEFVKVMPETNRAFYIRHNNGTNFTIDVPSSNLAKGTFLQLYTFNRTRAQKFYLVERSDGYYAIVYQFGNRDFNINGANTVNGARICVYENPDYTPEQEHEKWALKYYEDREAFRFEAKKNREFGIDLKNGTLANGTQIQLYQATNSAGGDNTPAQSWKLTYCDWYQYLKWDGKNIIECMFGTDDNSMSEAYPQVDENHTTAMIDNYNCYFGDMSKYPQDLMPRQIYLTDKEFTDFKETRTMENVLTGIIPEGSGNEMLSWSDTTGHAGRIVKGSYWDKYEVNRIDKVTYDDIALSTDDPNNKNAFTDRGAYDSALKNAALMDLRKKKYCEPDVQTETSIVDLFRDSNPTVGQAKLNDELIYISDDGTRRQKFYFESLTYDLLMERITNADLVEEMEVE